MTIKYVDGRYFYEDNPLEEVDLNRYKGWQKEDYEKAEIEFIEPMGAKDSMEKDIEDLFSNPQYYVDEKIDGGRCLLHIFTDHSRAFSRNVVKKSNWLGEYTDKVPHLGRIGSSYHMGTVLDGELMIPDQPCNVTSGTLNCLAEESFKRQYFDVGFAVLYVFDIVRHKGEDVTHLPMLERRVLADRVVRELNNEWVQSVDFFNDRIIVPFDERLIDLDKDKFPSLFELLDTNEDIFSCPDLILNKKQYYEYVVSLGGEGVMFKYQYGDYVEGYKGRQFQKLKKTVTRDVIVSGYGLPTREYEGKFPNDRWPYWEDIKGTQLSYYIAVEHSAEELLKDDWIPVTKYWYMGWIGNIKFDVLSPAFTTNKMKLGLVTVDKQICNTVQCGECKGISEEVAMMFSKNKDAYIGTVMEVECNGVFENTGMLRHPRYARLRKDKDFSMCTWENHIEG